MPRECPFHRVSRGKSSKGAEHTLGEITVHRFVLPFTLMAAATIAIAQDRSSARSIVISPYGIVATSQVQASQAGAQILARGGSAVDAAIAANATLGVI